MIQSSNLYIPLIDTTWTHNDEGAFELYYALRHHIMTGSPTILPCFEGALLEASEAETARIRDSLTDSQLETLLMLQDACPSINTMEDAKTAAVQTINLLVQFGVKLPETSVATGTRLATVYTDKFKTLSNHRPNSALMKLLENITGPTQVKSLDMAKFFIADAGCIALVGPLGMLPLLTKLDLSDNGITNRGIAALCQKIKTHPSLSDINLANNDKKKILIDIFNLTF